MKNSILKAAAVSAALTALIFSVPAFAADKGPQPKKYDGIITQINPYDGTFTLRLRDGSTTTVVSPLVFQLFLSLKGVLDPIKNTIDKVTDINVKNSAGPDAMPVISGLDPGSAQWGSKLTVSGTGFTKKTNSISIGGNKNAIINIPSSGEKLTFSLPAKICDKKNKINCASSKFYLPAANYNLIVSNENGVSNPISFTVNPLPPLSINNDPFPQGVGGAHYNLPLMGTGGAEDYVWKISYGSLPPGLTISQAGCSDMPCRAAGLIAGTPTKTGVYDFILSLISGGESIAKQFSITIQQPISDPGYRF